MNLTEAIAKLDELEKSTYALNHAQSILYVDGDTVAPKNSWKGRGMALAYLTELAYKQLVNPETGEMLETILQHKEEKFVIDFLRCISIKELHILSVEERYNKILICIIQRQIISQSLRTYNIEDSLCLWVVSKIVFQKQICTCRCYRLIAGQVCNVSAVLFMIPELITHAVPKYHSRASRIMFRLPNRVEHFTRKAGKVDLKDEYHCVHSRD